MEWGEDMRCHILTVGIRDSFLNALESTVQKDKIQIISSPSLEIAGWLLAHRRFAVIVADLEIFSQLTSTFQYEIRRQSPYVIVLGDAGTKYSRPVEHEANLFLSYQIPLSKLWSHIMKAFALYVDD